MAVFDDAGPVAHHRRGHRLSWLPHRPPANRDGTVNREPLSPTELWPCRIDDGRSMKDIRTDDVDLVIVGSGPCGSAYARELHTQAPQARLLLVEVGPQISDPAGSHVKNIRDDARRQQAQLASQGPAASQTPEGRQPVPGRAGTFLVDGHPDPAGGGMPADAMPAI